LYRTIKFEDTEALKDTEAQTDTPCSLVCVRQFTYLFTVTD